MIGVHWRRSHRRIRGAAVGLVLSGVAAILPWGATYAQRSTAPSDAHNTRADTSCVAALDSLQAIFPRDYPGYHDKVPGHEAALRALTDSVRAIAQASDDYHVCIPALQRWIHFFHDPHMALWYAGPPAPHPPAQQSHRGTSDAPDVAADDPSRPSVRFLDDSTTVLRLATLDVRYRPVTDSVVAANRARLLSTPYLIIDMRGNRGGCTCVYDSLTPLLYTRPIALPGADMLASADNIAFLRKWIEENPLAEEDKAAFRTALRRMAGHQGQLVTLVADTVLRVDTVYPMPRRIAVLVDSGCASSCEDFVMQAKQSAKVTVLGTSHTAGALDYGNVHNVPLPGWRIVRIPSTRDRRLRTGLPLANVGIAPDVLIPAGASDPVGFAQRYLTSHDTSNDASRSKGSG